VKPKRRLTPEVAASKAARRSKAITGFHNRTKKESDMSPQEKQDAITTEVERACAGYAHNDVGNARRLVKRFGEVLEYKDGIWKCRYHEGNWGNAPEWILTSLALRTVEQMYGEVDYANLGDSESDSERFESIIAWAKESGMRERIEAMIFLARCLMVKP